MKFFNHPIGLVWKIGLGAQRCARFLFWVYNGSMEHEQKEMESEAKHVVHYVLAHSYGLYFFVLLLGVALDEFFPIKILSTELSGYAGFFFLIFASVVIFWSQQTSSDTRHFRKKKEELTKEHFHRGPYKYSKMPTHWGLFFLMLGFGLVLNAFFITVLTVISFFISWGTLVKRHEAELERKYGEPYKEYKKSHRV